MADLLIKGMEMPKNCMDCSCSTWKFDDPVPFICLIAKVNCELKCRPSNCPLVEVKPHGRCIDADKAYETMLYEMCGTGYQYNACSILNSEFYTPTVLEANNE